MSIIEKKYVWKTLSNDDTLSEPQTGNKPGNLFTDVDLNNYPHQSYSTKYGYETKELALEALEGFLTDNPWFVQSLVLVPIYSRKHKQPPSEK
jgi:hypothetical protein